MRPKVPDLRVFAYATPAGLISRDAARYTESFAFTVGIGDDFVMRLGVESTENLRTSIIETIRACKLPKYRIMLNGLGYMLFGIPSRDLETTWYDVTQISSAVQPAKPGQSPLLDQRSKIATIATVIFRFGVLISVQYRSSPVTENQKPRKLLLGTPTELLGFLVLSEIDCVLFFTGKSPSFSGNCKTPFCQDSTLHWW